MMKMDFSGKRVVITGGGVGIGLEIARTFVSSGAVVASADIRVTPELRDLTEKSTGFALELDLSSASGPPTLVEAAAKKFGGIDILINNLGVSPVRQGFVQTTDSDWESTFNINFFSMVRATRSAIPHLIKSKGVVVSIASVLAREPLTIQPDYCATKAALLNLSKTLSTEFGPDGVRFVCVSPGPTLTPQWTDPGGQIEQYAHRHKVSTDDALNTLIPDELGLVLGRFVMPQEIANTVLFAASDHAGAITGTELLVDAGMRKSV